jgi:manganese/zinc/iron transport system substrate-binding protein
MRLGITLSLVLTIFGFGCKQSGEVDNGKKKVVCTIGMIADVARNIGGDKVDVIGLMGSGVDPHLYKATAGDVSRLRSADVILFNGLHLESKMGEVLEKMGSSKIAVPVAEVIPKEKIQEADGAHDPHVWFNVELWMTATEAVKDALIKADPANKTTFEANYAAYRKKLEELDAYVKKRAEELPKDQRVIVTAHDAFNYFGTAYGFEVRGLQGISTVTEAGTADVQKLSEFIATRKVKAIFVESSVPRRNVEALQAAVKDRGFDVKIGGELFSDAMGDAGTEEGTYLGMVRHNIDTIVNGLSGKTK